MVTSHLIANKELGLMDKVHMVAKGKEETLMDNRATAGRRALDMVVVPGSHKEQTVMDSRAPMEDRVPVDTVLARPKEAAAMEDGVKVHKTGSCICTEPASTCTMRLLQPG